MRVLVMGAGGMGGFLGARMAQAGHDVTLVARGTHLEVIQRDGLTIRMDEGGKQLADLVAVRYPSEVKGPVDLALFSVKTYDTEPAAEALALSMGPTGLVFSVQNGITGIDRLNNKFGTDRVLPGVSWITSHVVGPGVIHCLDEEHRVDVGWQTDTARSGAMVVADAFEQSGIPDVRRHADWSVMLWSKLTLVAPLMAVATSAMLRYRHLKGQPGVNALLYSLLEEAISTARASGVAVPDTIRDEFRSIVDEIADDGAPSLLLDYERERRVELDDVIGALVQRAHRLCVPTPHFDSLYPILRARAVAFGGVAGTEERFDDRGRES